jgi:hypothetical protein
MSFAFAIFSFHNRLKDAELFKALVRYEDRCDVDPSCRPTLKSSTPMATSIKRVQFQRKVGIAPQRESDTVSRSLWCLRLASVELLGAD